MSNQTLGRPSRENETFKASVDFSEFKANLSNLARTWLKIILSGVAENIVGNLPSICDDLNSIPHTTAGE